MTNSIIGLLSASATTFAFGISLVSNPKGGASRSAKSESEFTEPLQKPTSTSSVALWAIVIILLIGAWGSLVVFLAPDDALRARFLMLNQDRTIRPITPSQLRLIHASGLVLFFGFVSCAAFLYLRRTPARNIADHVLKDARTFFRTIITGGREWITSGHRAEVICLAVIFLIAVAIRLFFLTQPMAYDEAITVVRFSSRPLLDVVSDYTMANNHVFHTILVHLSSRLFGILPAVVRLPAFLAGLMVVPLSFWLIRRLFDDYTALLTVGLTAVAPAMVEFSVQARGYTILTLFFLSAFVVATYLKEQSSITGWAIFIITFTLGAFTMPTMLYSFGVVVLWLLWAASKQRRKRLLVELTLASLAIAIGALLLYLPLMLRSGYRSLWANEAITRLSFVQFLKGNASNGLFTLGCWSGSHYQPFVVLIGLIVVAAVFFSWHYQKSAIFVLPAIFLWIVPLICFQRIAPLPRHFNFLFPIFAGFASYGLSMFFRKLPIRKPRAAQYLWIALVIVISGYWGIRRLMVPCAPFPGAEGINQCAEGFFVDAKTIVNDLKPILRERDALVAHVNSGIVESSQFYLLEANRRPTLVHAYSPGKGLHQLDKYDQLFVVTRRNAPQSRAAEDRADVEKMFSCSHEDFERTFDNPELVASYQISDLYRLRRKSTASNLISNQSRPSGRY
jgi:hypothetical protein